MAAFQTSSKWLKLSLLEIHLSLFLFVFPIAAIGWMDIGRATILSLTGLFLLCSCVFTFTWVFVKEIYNNRLIHLGVLVSDLLVCIFAISSAIALFNAYHYPQSDNVIEASIGTAILTLVAGLFVITEMKNFRLTFPRLRQKGNNVEQKDNNINTEDKVNEPHQEEPKPSPRGERTINGPFFKNSMWLKYAFYFYGLSLFFNFLPTEPVMYGGTRELTSLVYFSSILAITFLFCWVFVGSLRKNKAFHILAAIFQFLSGLFSIILMILWAIRDKTHHFTPVLHTVGGILAILSGVAVVLEIRHQKLSPKTRYLDRECAASCFNSMIRAFKIPGVAVVVDDENDINGDLNEKYMATSSGPPSTGTPSTPVIIRDPPKTEGKKESIMSVDHANLSHTDVTKTDKDVKKKDKIAEERVNLPKDTDGFHSPKNTPPANPFLDSSVEDSKAISEIKRHDIVQSNEPLPAIKDEKKTVEAQNKDNSGQVKANEQKEEADNKSAANRTYSKNTRVTGMDNNDKLPVVSGMKNEPVKKGYNPFGEED